MLRAILLLVPATLLASATGDAADMRHDFGARSSGNRQQLCSPCHMPQQARTAGLVAPMWGHETTSASFTTYESPAPNASADRPGGVTKLCLSCHDGTIAIDSFAGLVEPRTIGRRGNAGVDLTRHHPVSFVYDSALAVADGELWDPQTTPSGLGGTIAQDMLRDGRLECSACHFAHGGGRGETLALLKSNSKSALCLTCHKK